MSVSTYTPNRNASPELFGWDFQVSAAVGLFIHHIRDAVSLRLEGKTEDVEITLSEGGKIYIQAKSTVHPDKYGDTTKLGDALESLSEASCREDCRRLIYATNDTIPFGKSRGCGYLGNDTILTYDELAKDARSCIDRFVSRRDLNFKGVQSLEVFVMGFHGDDEKTRYRVLTNRIRDFIDTIDTARISAQSLRRSWFVLIFENGSKQNYSISVSKAEFIWPIVVQLCSASALDWQNMDYDEDEIAEFEQSYRSFIEDASEQFEIIASVLTDYDDFRAVHRSLKRPELNRCFIDKSWEGLSDRLGLRSTKDPHSSEIICRLILRKVILRQEGIRKIKEVTGL